MKKSLLVLLIAMFGLVPKSKAIIIIANNMPCDVLVSLNAHDANYPTLCTLFLAPRFTVAAGSSVVYNNVPAANPDWWVPAIPVALNVTAILAGSQFDAAIVDYQGFGGMVGNLAGCATTMLISGSGGTGACASTCNISWTQIGATIVVSIDP